MSRRSSISRLPAEIRARLDDLIREGALTIDELAAEVQEMGGQVSRSAVGRYKKRMEERLAEYRQASEVAGVWVAELGAERDSPMGQLLAQLLQTIAFRTLAELGENESGIDPKDLHFLARSLSDLARTEKTNLEVRERYRRDWEQEMRERAEAAQEEVAEVAKSAGLTPEAERRLREIVLGVVS